MDEQQWSPKLLDDFSNLMWGLCLAGSLAVLADVSRITGLREFAVRAICALCVALMVLRNYFVNRTVLARYGHLYEKTGHLYGEMFNWLLTTYILTFFGPVVFQNRPLLGPLSLVPVSLVGIAVLRYELGVQKTTLASASKEDLLEDCREAIVDLRRLYTFWLWFDLALGVAGLVLAYMVWRGWLGATWCEVLAFSVVLGIFNVFDLTWNRKFHFARVKPSKPC